MLNAVIEAFCHMKKWFQLQVMGHLRWWGKRLVSYSCLSKKQNIKSFSSNALTSRSSLRQGQQKNVWRTPQRCHRNGKLQLGLRSKLPTVSSKSSMHNMNVCFCAIISGDWAEDESFDRFVACLDEIRLFMHEKRQVYFTDEGWLTNLVLLRILPCTLMLWTSNYKSLEKYQTGCSLISKHLRRN